MRNLNRLRSAAGLVAVAMLVGVPAGAHHDPGYADVCAANELGPDDHGYWILYGGRECHIDRISDDTAYAGTGTWRLEILRAGKHSAGEWLDAQGHVVDADTPARPVVRTRIILTSSNARPACGSAIARGDAVHATMSGEGSTLTLSSPPGGGAVETIAMRAAFPGDHRDCLR